MNEQQILRPHQVQPVEKLLETLRQFDSAVDGSDTGVGKTFVACAVAVALGQPTLVIAPKISITNWRETIKIFNDVVSISNYELIATGKTPYGSWRNQEALRSRGPLTFLCENCLRKFDEGERLEPCCYHAAGIHCISTKRTSVKRGDFLFNPAVKFVIFDEGHRCGGIDSLNADILDGCKRQRIKHLILSATLADSPLKLKAIGASLDLHNGRHDSILPPKPNFYRWAAKYKCRRDPAFRGLKWFANEKEKRDIMASINSQIYPARGVRVSVEDIPGFPEQQIIPELYDIDEPEKLDALYKEMADALGLLEVKVLGDSDSAATKILRARQKVGLLKVPVAVELAQDALEAGRSVVVFANFHAEIDELTKRLDCPYIDGRVSDKQRTSILADFQSNKQRSLVLQSDAAGITINLQDLDGEHPRLGLVFPPWSATVFTQLTGRFRRIGGRSKSIFKILFAAGTVETKMHSALRSKISCQQMLNDGDFRPDFFRLHKAGEAIHS